MTMLLLQVTVVLAITVSFGWIARKLGQSRVVGEIIGGVFLGPSVLGRFAPSTMERVFSSASLSSLEVLSSIGLVLFMFLTGIEVDCSRLYRKRFTAIAVSITGIVFPFVIGIILANSLRNRFPSPNSSLLPFVLFLGISMGITAFPILVRIVEDQGLEQTPLGTVAIFCAATDDIAAWVLLSVGLVLVGPRGGNASLGLRGGALCGFILVMLGILRPLGVRIIRHNKCPTLSPELFGIVLAGAFASAAATEWIGVHPLFGAFLFGISFPRVPQWQRAVRTALHTVVSSLLLPLFFALTGLKTRLDLLTGSGVLVWTAVIVVAAVFGKLGGVTIAARWMGESWNTSIALGVLMNTRGLVELIVLNIAYAIGVFSPTLFTMLVMMALLTTMVTTPVLRLLRVDDSFRGPFEQPKQIFNTTSACVLGPEDI